jgi:hypothetical protein
MDIEQLSDLQKNNRVEALELLELFSSEYEQRDYQEKVPIVNVPDELFNQWEDCYELPLSHAWHKQAYTNEEYLALRVFNGTVQKVASRTPQCLPALPDFIGASEWHALKDAALSAIKAFKYRKT